MSDARPMRNGRPLLYVLNDKREAVPVQSPMEWAEHWLRYRADADAFAAYARVGRDEVGEWEVSTVFLGVDVSMFSREPLVFETMLFGPDCADVLDRYATWEQAANAHAMYAAAVRELHAQTEEVTASALRRAMEGER